jgi:hypothetical protein
MDRARRSAWSFGGKAPFMNRFLGHTVFLPAILAAGVWTEAAQAPGTPAEEYKALLEEFHAASQAHFQAATTETERTQIVARVDKVASGCLELVLTTDSQLKTQNSLNLS